MVGNEYLQACAQLLPAATVAEIAGAGHFSMLERPDRFSQAVAAFLDS
jgi:pimeloyl-ACP methyl ester carboxylesterase